MTDLPPTSPIDQWLPRFQAKSVRLGNQRYYQDDRGVKLPSVTAILDATKPQAAREALQQWRNRVGAAAAQQISSAASRRGSQTHKHLQQYLLGKPQTCPEAIAPYWQSLATVLPQVQQVRLVEGFVFHDRLGYGGKVDCVASYDGIPCVLDWKTADRPKGSIERLNDAPLQLAAYCGAVNECYADRQVSLQAAGVIVAVPDQPAEIFWLNETQLADYWEQWLQRLQAFQRRYAKSNF